MSQFSTANDDKFVLIGLSLDYVLGLDPFRRFLTELERESQVTSLSDIYHCRNQNSEKLIAVIKVRVPKKIEELYAYIRSLELTLKLDFPQREISAYFLCASQEVRLRPDFILPHPGLVDERGFLVPAKDVWPDYIHPILGKAISELSVMRQIGEILFYAQGRQIFKGKI